MRLPLPYTTGRIEPTIPRVMQRSYSVKASGPSNGPSPKLPRSRGAARFCASGVSGGKRPSAGSVMSEV
jgi:hypothetical protein